MSAELFALQQQLADAVRKRHTQPVEGMPAERVAVYQDLVFNNVRGFIRSAFPVLRSIVGDTQWDHCIAAFFAHSQLDSPYFIDIPRAFYDYLAHHIAGHVTRHVTNQITNDASQWPDFALELAYYEWLELDLYRRAGGLPPEPTPPQALSDHPDALWQLGQSVELVACRYPVHQLSPEYQPLTAPVEPTFLALYRTSQGKVQFMQLTAVSMAVLQLLQTTPQSISGLCQQLSPLVPNLTEQNLQAGVQQLLLQCVHLGLVWPSTPVNC